MNYYIFSISLFFITASIFVNCNEDQVLEDKISIFGKGKSKLSLLAERGASTTKTVMKDFICKGSNILGRLTSYSSYQVNFKCTESDTVLQNTPYNLTICKNRRVPINLYNLTTVIRSRKCKRYIEQSGEINEGVCAGALFESDFLLVPDDEKAWKNLKEPLTRLLSENATLKVIGGRCNAICTGYVLEELNPPYKIDLLSIISSIKP